MSGKQHPVTGSSRGLGLGVGGARMPGRRAECADTHENCPEPP